MEDIKVSLITISYNSSSCIENAIKSVFAQDYGNIEYIIVDGGSTDSTMDIINKYRDKIAKIVSEPDRGISDAFNKGIAMATGKLIGIVNSDDKLIEGAISNLVSEYEEGIDIYRGNQLIQNPGSNTLFREKPSMKFSTTPVFVSVSHGSTFVTKEAYRKYGTYDIKMKYAMDLDFLIRSYKMGARMKYINHDMEIFSTGGATSTPLKKKKSELLYLAKKNGASTIHAYGFYLAMKMVDWGKSALDQLDPELKKKLRMKKL